MRRQIIYLSIWSFSFLAVNMTTPYLLQITFNFRQVTMCNWNSVLGVVGKVSDVVFIYKSVQPKNAPDFNSTTNLFSVLFTYLFTPKSAERYNAGLMSGVDFFFSYFFVRSQLLGCRLIQYSFFVGSFSVQSLATVSISLVITWHSGSIYFTTMGLFFDVIFTRVTTISDEISELNDNTQRVYIEVTQIFVNANSYVLFVLEYILLHFFFNSACSCHFFNTLDYTLPCINVAVVTFSTISAFVF